MAQLTGREVLHTSTMQNYHASAVKLRLLNPVDCEFQFTVIKNDTVFKKNNET